MKYVVALAACALVILFWAIIGATVFNWQHGGGILWQLVIWGTVVAVWIAITARWPKDKKSEKGRNKPIQRSGLVSSLDFFNASSEYDTPTHAEDTPHNYHHKAQNKELYAKALDELENCTIDKGTWALALSESMGKEQEARALYIRFRVAELGATTDGVSEEQFIEHLRKLARTRVADTDNIPPETFDGDPHTLVQPQSVSALADRIGLLDFQIIDLIKAGRLKGVRRGDEWFVGMSVIK